MHFIALKQKNNYSKCSAFASFALFASIFHFKLHIVFVDWEARIFLASERRVPYSYATEIKTSNNFLSLKWYFIQQRGVQVPTV